MVQHPLYVDLDGTFIKSDMLIEYFLVAVKNNPLVLFYAVLWLLQGKAFLKAKLCEEVAVNVAGIPINQATYTFLANEKEKGRPIFLATASNECIAEQFCEHYPLFDGYIASTDNINLKGATKLNAIKEKHASFSYMGNSIEDYVLFAEADEKYLVAPTRAAQKRSSVGDIEFTGSFDVASSSNAKAWIKQLRVYQWLKNSLIFVPLLVSAQYTSLLSISQVVAAFFAFSLLASATYIFNDMVDLDADRIHTRKRHRPLASGAISLTDGVYAALLLLSLSLIIAAFLPLAFGVVLFVYLCITLSYSFCLKSFFGMDVITLASLYTIRIFAGAAVLGVTVSFWLLSFSMFIFLSLALIKRCAELVALAKDEKEQAHGRDYNVSDLTVFVTFGVSSAMLAILMYCFYMNAETLTLMYVEPQLLWLSVPLLGYWLMRMWVKTMRGEMTDDPIIFSLKDQGSLIPIALMGLITIMANFL